MKILKEWGQMNPLVDYGNNDLLSLQSVCQLAFYGLIGSRSYDREDDICVINRYSFCQSQWLSGLLWHIHFNALSYREGLKTPHYGLFVIVAAITNENFEGHEFIL